MEEATTPLQIYIAGPYTAATPDQIQHNVNAAIDVSIALYKLGHFPYVPHLTHFIDVRANAIGQTLTWEDYIRWDLAWLRLCDALLLLGRSPGADRELAAARQQGMLIFYRLGDVPPARRDRG